MTVYKALAELEINPLTFAGYVPPTGIDVNWIWEYNKLEAKDRGRKCLAVFSCSDNMPAPATKNIDDIIAELTHNNAFAVKWHDKNLKQIYEDDTVPFKKGDKWIKAESILSDPRLPAKARKAAKDKREVIIPDDNLIDTNRELLQHGLERVKPVEGTAKRMAKLSELKGTEPTEDEPEIPVHVYEQAVIEDE